MRFNHHFANKFGACRLLKVAQDPHRNREVRIYMLPGEFDIVGMTDGVDVWIAPTVTGFLEDVRKMLGEIRAGGDPGPLASKRAVSTPGNTAARRRIADVVPAPTPQEQSVRRRIIVAAEIPSTQPRRERRVIRA